MTRISKNSEKRGVSPRRPKVSGPKGPGRDNLKKGYKEHANAVENAAHLQVFIPKIK